LAYEFLLRRFAVLRLAFGIKTHGSPAFADRRTAARSVQPG